MAVLAMARVGNGINSSQFVLAYQYILHLQIITAPLSIRQFILPSGRGIFKFAVNFLYSITRYNITRCLINACSTQVYI